MALRQGKNPTYEKVVVKAPASTSNLGPGFDVLGLALGVMYDEVEVARMEERDVLLEVGGVGSEIIPTNPDENSAGVVALEFMKWLKEGGFKIKITKGIPPGSGLGSSGASAAATAVAINHMLDLKLDKKKLAEIAAQGEKASAGAPHVDNVAPSIYGGFIVVCSYHPLKILDFPPPKVEFALAVPRGIKKTTKDARDLLPRKAPLSAIINNLGAVSTVVAGMLMSDPKLIGMGMLGDKIVEPARSPLYPWLTKVKNAAMGAGAFGVTLSGAGPSVIAVCGDKRTAVEVAEAMRGAFNTEGIECNAYTSRAASGAKVIRTI
jgi:homoserine kinase